jgi:lipooligosaccharide transport system permease protein
MAATAVRAKTWLGSPPGDRLFGNARMVLLRNLMVHRHTWTLLAFGVVEPVLYLLSIGIGVGVMIGPLHTLGPSVTYPMYIAPGLLATAAMNGSINATSIGVFDNLRYGSMYQTMISTPIRPRGIAFGETAWALIRGAIKATGFLAVMTAAGLVRSPWALLAVPAAVLIGYTFAAAGLLIATLLREWADTQLIQLILLPMFLFATTFYPLSVYPVPVQWLVRVLRCSTASSWSGTSSWAPPGSAWCGQRCTSPCWAPPACGSRPAGSGEGCELRCPSS